MEHLSDELLDRYADDALTAQERAAAEAHLTVCDRCRRELAAVRGLFAAFAAVPTEPLLLDLAPRVVRRIAPQPQRRYGWLVAGVLAAQATLALALALWLLPSLAAETLPGLAWSGLDWSAAGLRGWLPPRVPPLAILAPLQWALVVAGMAIFWLVGNRLALAGAASFRRGEEMG